MRQRNAEVPKPDYYTIPDVMALLSVGRTTIYKLIDSGDLKRVSIGSLVRITADSYKTFRAKLEVPQ